MSEREGEAGSNRRERVRECVENVERGGEAGSNRRERVGGGVESVEKEAGSNRKPGTTCISSVDLRRTVGQGIVERAPAAGESTSS